MPTTKELDPVAIGIKKKIIEKGLLQKAVAERAGFTEQQFSDMLKGILGASRGNRWLTPLPFYAMLPM